MNKKHVAIGIGALVTVAIVVALAVTYQTSLARSEVLTKTLGNAT